MSVFLPSFASKLSLWNVTGQADICPEGSEEENGPALPQRVSGSASSGVSVCVYCLVFGWPLGSTDRKHYLAGVDGDNQEEEEEVEEEEMEEEKEEKGEEGWGGVKLHKHQKVEGGCESAREPGLRHQSM